MLGEFNVALLVDADGINPCSVGVAHAGGMLHVVPKALYRLSNNAEMFPIHNGIGYGPRARNFAANVVLGERGRDLKLRCGSAVRSI